jgi:membrane protein implicated in regulation of membrane protease activity
MIRGILYILRCVVSGFLTMFCAKIAVVSFVKGQILQGLSFTVIALVLVILFWKPYRKFYRKQN